MFRLMVYLYDLKHRTAPFSLGTRHLIFLHVAECLFPRVPSRGLQDILLDLLQRGLAAHLPNRTQMDVARSIPAIVVSARLSVCAAGRLQACPLHLM